MTKLQVLTDEFNSIVGDLDYTFWLTGTCYEKGKLVFVDTPWACGFLPGDEVKRDD